MSDEHQALDKHFTNRLRVRDYRENMWVFVFLPLPHDCGLMTTTFFANAHDFQVGEQNFVTNIYSSPSFSSPGGPLKGKFVSSCPIQHL